jgi:DNA modification methylase
MTQPYTLHQGDCLEVMKSIEPGSVDLILADLPYGVSNCSWDTVIPFEPLWACYKSILKPRGAVVLTASQPFTSALVMSNRKWFRYEWIWEKPKGANFALANKRPLCVHESVLVFGHQGVPYNPIKFDLDRISVRNPGPRNSLKECATIRPGSSTGILHLGGTYVGRFPRSVMKFANEAGGRGSHHPTQKPVALMEYLIRTYTQTGETVLDNVMGSGTTGVAAMNTGRRFVGIELDAAYYAIAEKRIKEAIGVPAVKSVQDDDAKLFRLTAR